MNTKLLIVLFGAIVFLAVAIADISLTPSNSSIIYTKEELQSITSAGLQNITVGEVQCNDNNCWVKLEYIRGTDIIAVRGVNKLSTEQQIKTARDTALKSWTLDKAKLINEASVKRDKGTIEPKLGAGNITATEK